MTRPSHPLWACTPLVPPDRRRSEDDTETRYSPAVDDRRADDTPHRQRLPKNNGIRRKDGDWEIDTMGSIT